MPPEWEEFAAGRPIAGPDREGWNRLERVRHGTHLTAALRVAEDGAVSADLIYDGVLRETRTQVVYFSPNTWGDGSRYGTFEFGISWDALIGNRRLYWVEAIRSYKHTIYRFLASRRDVSALPVTPYDPNTDSGPIRCVEGEWFWATGFAAEIVLDEDVPLAEIDTLTFQKHHDRYCSLGLGTTCVEAGHTGFGRTASRLLAVLLGRDLRSLDRLLTTAGRPSSDYGYGLSNLYQGLGGFGSFQGAISDDVAASEVLRAACLVWHTGDSARTKALTGMIDTKDRVLRLLLDLVRVRFNCSDYDWE